MLAMMDRAAASLKPRNKTTGMAASAGIPRRPPFARTSQTGGRLNLTQLGRKWSWKWREEKWKFEGELCARLRPTSTLGRRVT